MSLTLKESLAKAAAQSATTNGISTMSLVNPLMVAAEEIEDIPAYDGESEWSLPDSKYRIYEEYFDANYSTIDELKNIHINPKQTTFSQEANAQYIPFEMPRMYDGFDLKTTTLWFHFINAEGGDGYDEPVNVRYSDTKIRFAWLMNERVTAIAGNLSFELHATGLNSHKDRYEWISRPNRDLTILPSLCGNGVFVPESHPDMDVLISDDGNGNVFLDIGVAGESLPDGEEIAF